MRLRSLVIACALAAATAANAGDALLLDESGWWRQHCCFGPDRVSPDLLRSEGGRLLGAAALGRVKAETEQGMRRAGLDPSKADWRDHVLVRFLLDPYTTPLTPPAADGWETPAFDDGSWVLMRGLFHGGGASARPVPKMGGWTRDDLDEGPFASLGIRSCCYRARFVLDDPAKAGDVTLRVAYHGGVRVFVNGHEAARGHLPKGALAPDAPGDDYPAEAYRQDPSPRDRELGPVTIPQALLVKGVNTLALEVRASRLNPVVLTMNLATYNHKVRQGREGLWPHAWVSKIDLRCASTSAPAAAGGLAVWVRDPHERVRSTDAPPPGETPGTVRFAAARNGTFGAEIAVRAPGAISGLTVTPGELRRTGGAERLAAGAIRVLYPAPFPEDEFTEAKLGDERGLGASFPDAATLDRYDRLEGSAGPWIFDRLVETPPRTIPPDFCRPVWLSLRVPADAAPGTYRGTVDVAARGLATARLPVEVDLADWRLPDPKDFRTFAGCEENPCGVAKQYGVKLWSEEHWRLVEASLRQLARIGGDWLNVPVLARTEFGNGDDSMIRWTRRKDGSLAFDYGVLDRYLDLAMKHCGRPQVVNFVVMQGMKSAATPPAEPHVTVFEESTGKPVPLVLSGAAKETAWGAFATALYAHMKARGLADAMYWGFPWEGEDDPDLKTLLEKFTPKVLWAASPHEMMWNATYANDRHYGALATVRYQPGGGRSSASFRVDRGWKSPFLRLFNPRVGGLSLAIDTVSLPVAWRLLPDRALACGHRGFARVGLDDWAAVHFEGMERTNWITGIPVLFTLWPGRDGAESSVRYETLIEGIQETEARIAIELALDRGGVGPAAANRARDVLDRRLADTGFLDGPMCVHEMECYYGGWQERSRDLYRVAAEATK